MRRGWMRCAAIVAFGALVSVGSAPVAMAAPVGASGLGPRGRSARAAGIVQPRGGDWEGSGPHGLRMSFELAGAGRSARLRYLAVSLPSGCRVGAAPSFYATYFARTYYYPPTRYPEAILGGVFEIKPAGDFAIVGIDSRLPKFPLVIVGRFSTARAGTAAVPAYQFKCQTGGWARTLHFALSARRRSGVADGTYTGTVVGPPPGVSGTLRATVVGGGRVLTDFAVSWTCPDNGGGFELGPSTATGEFIGSDGAIGEHWTPLGRWSGHFGPGGHFAGTFTNVGSGDCTQGQNTAFTATLTAG